MEIEAEDVIISQDDDVDPPGRKLQIVIRWGELDVDRREEVFREDQASASVANLLVQLISVFGDHMKQQLMELPIIRYLLRRNPEDFFTAAGQKLSSVPVLGTDLFFCPHSDNRQKVRQLRRLFSQLTFPDSWSFPPGSIEVSIDSGTGPSRHEAKETL